MKYKVEAILVQTNSFDIEADSEEEAIGKVNMLYENRTSYKSKWEESFKHIKLYGIDVFDSDKNFLKGVSGGFK